MQYGHLGAQRSGRLRALSKARATLEAPPCLWHTQGASHTRMALRALLLFRRHDTSYAGTHR